jgi:hypothetical protein
VHVAAACGDDFPAAQLVHTESVVAPVVAEDFPAGHEMQPVEASTAEYFPASQLAQVETPAAEYVPRGHREHVADDASQNMPPSQLVQVEAAVPENLPAAQAEQVLAPTESENLPAVQGVHVADTLHAAVKPSPVPEVSEPNHMLRKPVSDV